MFELSSTAKWVSVGFNHKAIMVIITNKFLIHLINPLKTVSLLLTIGKIKVFFVS